MMLRNSTQVRSWHVTSATLARGGAEANAERTGARGRQLGTLAALLASLSFGCSSRADDCWNTLTCSPTPAGGQSSAGGGATGSEEPSGSGGTGSVTLIGGSASSLLAGIGGNAAGGVNSLLSTIFSGGTTGAVGGTAAGGVAAIGGTSTSGGVGASGGAPTCNPACTGQTAVCDLSRLTCVQCLFDRDCPGSVCNTDTHSCVQCMGDGDCPGSACNTVSHTCVECLRNEHCREPNAVCDTSVHSCVECLLNDDCKGEKRACKITDSGDAGAKLHTCVECTQKTDCKGEKPLCDLTQNLCVECLDNRDCVNPAASLCVSGSCQPCKSNADCSHIADHTVCDTTFIPENDVDAGTGSTSTAQKGACVECTGHDYASCGKLLGKRIVCDSQKRSCSGDTEQSAELCQPCVTDAQCKPGMLCTEQVFAGASVGYFCLFQQGDTVHGAPATCGDTGRPYVKALATVSVDGTEADVCTLAVSTCPALAEYRAKSCSTPGGAADDKACGFAQGVDSKCMPFTATTNLCTVACLSDFDCPVNARCNTGSLARMCGF